jgi:hypothetical protein
MTGVAKHTHTGHEGAQDAEVVLAHEDSGFAVDTDFQGIHLTLLGAHKKRQAWQMDSAGFAE